ncbi:acetylglutamate kinase [Candidatus Formimonas warabiya]|uniref:Acetylglutamate kinase n=2 Tax=Formimonas warabiya TaxID=1761012 RepID=A0A3G1L0K1_FORW1|nr:acetylglutamate kinase [Candidatus Formimonas warabiya]
MLWEQHDVWTRMTIMGIVENLPDVDLITQRLLRNPKDFEAALRPFYGKRAAAHFSDLLTAHLTIAAELVKASKAGDDRAAADAERRWYANADEIARFLGRINPYWSQEEWERMLHDHLGLVKAEAVALLTKNYAEGIAVYDRIEEQSLTMADVMAEGIVRQFPNMFR